MTSFTLRGTYLGRPSHVSWIDGRLSGSPSAVGMVIWLSHQYQDRPITTAGGTTIHDHLTSAYSTCWLIQQVLGPMASLTTGALPPISDHLTAEIANADADNT